MRGRARPKLAPEARRAYAAVDIEDGFGIGVVTEGRPGYQRFTKYDGKRRNYQEAEQLANRLNAQLGVSPEDALQITASSMRKPARASHGKV